MYMLSMPIDEALNLASYSRYFKTLVIFEFGICTITALYFINNLEVSKKYNIILKIVLLLVMLVPAGLYNKSLNRLYTKPDTTSFIRNIILDYKSMYNIEEQKSYLVYAPERKEVGNGYLYYISRYDFRSGKVKVIEELSELENIDEIFTYDYLIMITKTEEIKNFLNIIEGDLESDVIRFR